MIKKLRSSIKALLLGSTLIVCAPNTSQALPNELIDYLNSLEITYSPIEKNRLLPKFLDNPPRGDTQLLGDFNGDNRIDFAVLTVNRDTYVSLLVFLRNKDGFDHYVLYDHNYSQNFNEYEIEEAIYPVIGEIKGLNEILKLKFLGIFSSASRDVFYWRDTGFNRFLTEHQE